MAVMLPSLLLATEPNFDLAESLGKRTEGRVYRDKVEVHFISETKQAWYSVNGANGTEYFTVDLKTGEKKPSAKDTLPKAPPREAKEVDARRSKTTGPATSVTFVNNSGSKISLFWLDTRGERKAYGTMEPGEESTMGTYAGHVWLAANANGDVMGKFIAEDRDTRAIITKESPKPPAAPAKNGAPGRWKVDIRNFNVWIHDNEKNEDFALTTDGTAANGYTGPLSWSPDGKFLATYRLEPGETRQINYVESSPKDQLQPTLKTITYAKPGDKIDHRRVTLFSMESRKQIPVSDLLFPNPWSLGDLRWMEDGKSFYFTYNQRGHQVFRLLAVDAASGAVRALAEETPKTFIDYTNKIWYQFLPGEKELIWMSERDGWNHLYLIDVATAKVKHQLTKGNWVVRKVEKVDAKAGKIWFSASGVRPGQDPYYLHLCRVNLDGSGLTVLTEGDGTHKWEFSDDGNYITDRWTRVDQPAVTEIRSASDGKLIAHLEKGDASALQATGWKAPERFSAKGRDGKTDIYGIICRPTNFDAKKKYPIVEKIYAGPQDYFVPKEFGRMTHDRELCELGFILVQIDGMGTNWRSKEFHDVCWKNLGDSGFLDRIAWLKAAAAAHPEMDISRVGIYGGSAGGQNALRALIDHGDFYKAAVADCGCHDNRMDKIWWNEQWMGWPIGKEYEDSSNVVNAHKLQGHLLLTWGELDSNVDPASSMQVVNALMKANKDFDMFVVPEANHGIGESPYLHRKRMAFFARWLAPAGS